MDCRDTDLRRVFELKVVREPTGCEAPTYLNDAADVYRMFADRWSVLDREEFLVLLLDNKNRMIGYNVVSLGSLTASLVHPREVFKVAVIRNTARIVLVHNHVSGNPVPSSEDTTITRRLKQAGEIMGIEVLDHVILGDGRYFSFQEQGML